MQTFLEDFLQKKIALQGQKKFPIYSDKFAKDEDFSYLCHALTYALTNNQTYEHRHARPGSGISQALP